MAKEGNLVVEGAKFYCSNSVDHNSPETAAALKVTSQTKKLGKNKYFASEKPIGTYLDDKALSFDSGKGFGNCKTPDGKQAPCAAKCSIKYSDYYENVEFNSSMKILLDVSTGKCPGYGLPGNIKISDSGQTKNTSTIKVNEKDAFQITAVSPQWPIADKSTKTSVKSIKGNMPFKFEVKAGETLYYMDEKSSFFFNFSFGDPKISLQADYSGDESKIVWGLFKGTETTDKVKTFVGLGKSFEQDVKKLLAGLEEGKYRLEAYGNKAGDPKCAVFIEYVKNFVEKITTPGESLLKGVAMPFTLKFKIDSSKPNVKILNSSFSGNQVPVQWSIIQGNNVLYKTGVTTTTGVVSVVNSGNIATITFKNAGKYKVQATTNEEGKPFSKEITVADKIGVKTVQHGDALLRVSGTVTAKVTDFNVSFLGNANKSIQWYLKKDGVGRIAAFELSATSKGNSISRKLTDLLNHDAGIPGGLYGNYILEAYAASSLVPNQAPEFKEAGAYLDCYHFEVAKNSIATVDLPDSVPLDAKIKFDATTRMAIATGEKVVVESESPDVVKNADGTLTFKKEGEYTINLHLEGNECDPKKITKKIIVSSPDLKRGLWCYESGYKRTETGYKEDSYGFIEIKGLSRQPLLAKVWLKGENESIYSDTEKKFLLEEKKITLNDEGSVSFKINTNDDYKGKMEKAIPPTAENPNPVYQLIFTIELESQQSGNITLPPDLAIKNTKAIRVGDKMLYEVLMEDEVLALTSEKKIKSIVFSDEKKKDIQRAQTTYGKPHQIWVHTVNMQEDELQVNVYKEIPDKAMTEKDGAFSALTSKKSYPDQKVGSNSMLKLDFTPDKEWNKPEEKSVDFYFAAVSKKGKDADGKDIFIPVKSQVTLVNADFKVALVTEKDLKNIGIKAKKEDGSALTEADMVKIRKEYLFYESGCLKVSKTDAVEVIENDISPVAVEFGEVKKKKDCYCDRDFTEDEVKDMVLKITGQDKIWSHKNCQIDDKSYKGLTFYLNKTFREHNVRKCVQKMAFLAMTSVETGFFQTAGEIASAAASSKLNYKGRGVLQLTGSSDGEPGNYKTYQKSISNNYDIIKDPELVAQKLSLAFDSGGWVWRNIVCPAWNQRAKKKNEDEATYKKIMEASKWKRDKFKKGLNKNLNDIALLIEDDEETYFFLVSRLLQGYGPTTTSDYPDTLHYDKRKENFQKLKTWFKYDKNNCNGDVDLGGLESPMFNYIKVAGRLIGTSEVSGTANNSVITGFFTEIGYKYDEGTSWCAAFVNYCLKVGNPEIPRKDLLNALSFSYSGYDEVETPFYGSFMVRADNSVFYKAGSQGHVSIVIGKVGDSFAQLGGNQSVPGEDAGTTVNVVLRKRQANVKYFHPTGVPKIALDKPLFPPAEKTAGKDTKNSDR